MQFQKNNVGKYKNTRRANMPYNQDYTQDEEYEINYTEPNNINVNQVPSPMMDSQEQIFDPNEHLEEERKEPSYFQSFGRGLNPKVNKGNKNQYISDQTFPSNKEEINDRSPKYVINVGASGDDYEYRMPNLPKQKQNSQNINNENYDGNQYEEEDYQEYQNDNQIPRRQLISRNRSPKEGQRNRNNSPHGYGGVIPMNQISPPQTFDEFNTSTDKNLDQNINRYGQMNSLRNNNQTIMSTQTYQQPPINMNQNQNQNLQTPSVLKILRDEVSNKYNNQTYNNMSYKDVQKIANRFAKVYDPHRNNNGILLEDSQVTVPGAQDEVFNNRYKVLSKMNRLSNILLAKKNKREPLQKRDTNLNTKTYNRNNSYNNKKPFDRHLL